LLDVHVQDAPKSGAPRKRTPLFDIELAEKVRKDRFSREKSTYQLEYEFRQQGREIGSTSIWSSLKEQGFKKVKLTKKPGLTPQMRKDRLQWCRDHADWTIED
ncbi:uncharacterized protein BDR25DRAFT_177460, partial [Lindgomyces ingoldianus]